MANEDQDIAGPDESEAGSVLEGVRGAASERDLTRKTWVRVLLLLGEILAVGGFAYVLGQVVTLTCDRVGTGQIDCIVQSTWLDLLPLRERAVRGVQGAQVNENCDEDGCTYRVELVTRAGLVPLTAHYSLDSAGKETIAQRVNEFARDATAPSLVVRDSSGWSVYVVLAAIVAGPLVWGVWRWGRSRADRSVG